MGKVNQLILKTEMLIQLSMVTLDMNLFGRITHLRDPVRKKLGRGYCVEMRIPCFILVHDLLAIEI